MEETINIEIVVRVGEEGGKMKFEDFEVKYKKSDRSFKIALTKLKDRIGEKIKENRVKFTKMNDQPLDYSIETSH